MYPRARSRRAAYDVRFTIRRRSPTPPSLRRSLDLTTRLDELKRCFEDHAPVLSGDSVKIEAAVALVLCEQDDDLSLLFIQRAAHDADRWSGHIAFPGGRIDPGDATAQQAAERETLEEVGLSLDNSHLIGRLDDLRGLSESILVSGFVYGLPERPRLTLNYEVENAFWLSLVEIESSRRNVERAFDYKGTDFVLPAIRVLEEDDTVLWGISYRFLELLMERAGRPIPSMPWMPNL